MKPLRVIFLSVGVFMLAGLVLAQVDNLNQPPPSASSLEVVVDGNPVSLLSFETGTSYRIDGSTILVSMGIADINVSAKEGMIQIGEGALVIEARDLRIRERETNKIVFAANVDGQENPIPAPGQREAGNNSEEDEEAARLPDASTAPAPKMPVTPKAGTPPTPPRPTVPSGRVPQNRSPARSR
jgi:hypothetical protein